MLKFLGFTLSCLFFCLGLQAKLLEYSELDSSYKLYPVSMRHSFLEFDRFQPPRLGFDYHIKSFRLIYETTNPHGKKVKASALVLIRSDIFEKKKQTEALVSYQHGARIDDSTAPSTVAVDPEALAAKMFYAREGFVVVMADYLGLGVSKEIQHYLNADQQSRTTWDALRATKEWFEKEGLPLSKNLFLSGYSQGGYVTLALQRKIQKEKLSLGIPLVASIPMSGVFDFSFFDEENLDDSNPQLLGFLAFMILAMSQVPEYNIDIFEIIVPEGHTIIQRYLDREIKSYELAKLASKLSTQLYTDDFFDRIVQKDHPVFAAIDKQNLTDGWLPKVPTYFLAAADDEIIPFSMSEQTHKKFQALGAESVFLENLGKGLNHSASVISAMERSREIIRSHLGMKAYIDAKQ